MRAVVASQSTLGEERVQRRRGVRAWAAWIGLAITLAVGLSFSARGTPRAAAREDVPHTTAATVNVPSESPSAPSATPAAPEAPPAVEPKAPRRPREVPFDRRATFGERK
jgi:hypothetical protein